MMELLPLSLSAHLGYLFTELALAERFAAARAAGFDAVEHPNPLSIPPETMKLMLKAEGLRFTQMAAGTGNTAKGEKGLAAIPGRETEFLENFKRSADYAETIGCPFVHPMAGVPPSDADAYAVADVYQSNIDACLGILKARPVKLLVEAISHAAVPGYHMHRLSQAIALSRGYGPGEVSVLLDTFHARANEEDALAIIMMDVDRIGHVHIADHPGRHEPGTGLFEFEPFVAQLKSSSFKGALGFEYIPETTTVAGLGWLPVWNGYADRQPARPGAGLNKEVTQ